MCDLCDCVVFLRTVCGSRDGRRKKTGRRMLRPRGRPKRRFIDVVKEDMKLVGVREEEAKDREADDSLW
ncbi:hypothetical protein LDENG_00171820 [Lucifuga dentata]|nr:hypothetical protein LDENG_00171820 [Lucifuga dentata]